VGVREGVGRWPGMWPAHQEVVGGGQGGWARGCVVHLLLQRPPLYSGEGVHLTPPPRQPREAAKGRRRPRGGGKGSGGHGGARPAPS
jgi:hypothetical protein